MIEAEKLVKSGVKELLVISQDTSAYGVDVKYRSGFWNGRPVKTRMTELCDALSELGIWVRLHYVYPYPTVDEVIPLMASGLVLPYLDVPLQHSHPDVLRRMKRPASGEKNLERIARWREGVSGRRIVRFAEAVRGCSSAFRLGPSAPVFRRVALNSATPLQPAAVHTPRKVFASLQAGRALAALLVVLLHLGLIIADAKYFDVPWVGTPFRWGDAGVEFFFVLSGFIITSAHAGDISRPSRLIPYLQRRAIRIYPPYWIVFALVFLLALPFSATRATLPTDPGTLTGA
jgi:hypothetical protein